MIKPSRLSRGDTVAIVSLSSGMGGEAMFRHRYEMGKSRLENDFGLNVVTMPHALKGIEYLAKNPQARAADLMAAFEDSQVKAIITMIGGDDSIRLLPYINFDTIKKNPKIFMGYSDTTANHFMMYKAGLTSFYGPSIMAEFAENVAMHNYTKNHIRNILFNPTPELAIEPSLTWTSEFLGWDKEENNKTARTMQDDPKGFELLQGTGVAKGKLLGGCVEVLPMIVGTEIWPQDWNNAILFLEIAEEKTGVEMVKYILRGLAAQGIFDCVSGVLFGKPMGEKNYDEYNKLLRQIIGDECGKPDLPILSNINFGHNAPMCVLPYGVMAEIDCTGKSLRLMEAAVV